MKRLVKSPITGSFNTEILNSYETSITSYCTLLNKNVENCICNDTSIIFNATGARGVENEFYSDDYDLHSESVLSEFKYEAEGGFIGIYDNIVNFITKNVDLRDKGKMLDIGCGKGLLLHKFNNRKPEWDQFAVEPSKNAISYFKEIMPTLNVFNGNFEDSPFLNQSFGLIMANGVLEHINNPVTFLEQIRKNLDDDGVLFIGVPNFRNNPVDLYTYDHLNRFTPESIKRIFEFTGFQIVAEESSGNKVPMWFVLKKGHINKEMKVDQVDINTQIELFNEAKNYIERTFESFNHFADQASEGKKVAIYGTGAIALVASRYTKLKFENISFFVDDNDSLWGTYKYGIEIKSPSALVSEKIEYVIISSNPCYHYAIINKLKSMNFNPSNIYL
jgi:SAM-dependent methyltransferase